ncbi:MAG: FAD-binding oxidoreductase [Thermoprotei archaeon]
MNIVVAESPRLSSFCEKRVRESDDPSIIYNYLADESRIVIGNAQKVIFPRCEAHISDVLRRANEKNILITVSGGGTGITGSRVPLGGIVLSTEELTEVETKNENEELIEHVESGIKYSIALGRNHEFYARAPPGIPLAIFKRMVESEGLFYPPDPTELSAFLGGTVATNASGSMTFYYGSTRDFVRRLRVVLTNGRVLDIKRGKIFADNYKFTIVVDGKNIEVDVPRYVMPNVEKNAAGLYAKPDMDLIDLFIGSEGILGVISEVEVRLIQKPELIYTFFVHFSDESEAIRFSRTLKNIAKKGELKILAIEFFDKNSVEFIREKYSGNIPSSSNAIIDVLIDASENANSVLNKFAEVLNKHNVLEAFMMDSRDAKEIRHALPEGINEFVRSKNVHKVATDIAVPDEHFNEMMQWYYKIGDKSKIRYVIFGHIGNNHLHFNFLPSNEDELKTAMKLITILLRKAVELKGTVSAEHGVGKRYYLEDDERRPLLELMYGREGLIQIAKLKHELDPKHILNIGNMIPKEYLAKI